MSLYKALNAIPNANSDWHYRVSWNWFRKTRIVCNKSLFILQEEQEFLDYPAIWPIMISFNRKFISKHGIYLSDFPRHCTVPYPALQTGLQKHCWNICWQKAVEKANFILTILPVSKVNGFLEVRMSGTDIPSEGLQILSVHPHVCSIPWDGQLLPRQ